MLALPLSRTTVEMAVHFVHPVLERGAYTEVFKRNSVYLFVLDPKMRYGECEFEDAILWERALGDEKLEDTFIEVKHMHVLTCTY